MKPYAKLYAALVLLVFGAAASECAIAQHHGGARFGGGYASPVYGRYYAPPMMAPYSVSSHVYASGTRDTSSDRLYAVWEAAKSDMVCEAP